MGIWAAIKYAMNSTLGTGNFSPLDKIIKDGLSDVDTNVIRLRGGVQTFTSNGTFTVPPGITKIWVTACAGGQSGERVSSGSSGVAGGAGGEYIFRKAFAVTPGTLVNITVGKGGSEGDHNVGESTVIGDLITLVGGGIDSQSTGGRGGAAAEYGENGLSNGGTPGGGSSTSAGGGGGGGSIGRGGNGNGYYGASSVQPGFGGGGGGGAYKGKNGQKGGDGIVIIEW